ncbi:hypothetical protein [Pedobacter sp. MC2016-24]|uniref:hypothetical protein n=1 Tax=Pedobacter sp. MC2016-24 TaxID=2780090 RepID=UPI001881F49D|nr:hypothetical protein [Pedobacter sp. MC2016-24]MBE9599690.1 hypothetical protein [Pedobacter sp. MC2016-24]
MEDKIQLIANTLLSSFLPKDPEQKSLSFHFTLPPNQSYKVYYEQAANGEWTFLRAEKVSI